MTDLSNPRAKGALARAESLSPEQRQEIARKAAKARWSQRQTDIPVAEYGSPDRPLRIGDLELPCYVLSDGTRVLTQGGFLSAIGRASRAKGGQGAGAVAGVVDKLPSFLAAGNLKPFISQDLIESTRPVVFQLSSGGKAFGYRAELLPQVCNVYLAARDARALLPGQQHIAVKADILIRGLAETGIIALVDEATGYQDIRARNALATILERFIAKELRKWVKTFPAEFYKELFRLRGWIFSETSQKRPSLIGKLTNDLVYSRLAPGVLEELRRLTPRDDKGRLRHHYHRRLSEDVGHPKLLEHLAAVTVLMKAFDTWSDFKLAIDRALPAYGKTLPLDLRLA